MHSNRGFIAAFGIAVAAGLGSGAWAAGGGPAQAPRSILKFHPVPKLVTPKSVGINTCNSTNACISESNSGSGPGASVDSSGGYGSIAATAFASAGQSSGVAGSIGQDLSTDGGVKNAGVLGRSSWGTGVVGESTYGAGIVGQSGTSGIGVSGTGGTGGVFEAYGYGVIGRTLNASGNTFAGVVGEENTGFPSNFGVIGTSNNGTGVFGSSSNATGIAALGEGTTGTAALSAFASGGGGGVTATTTSLTDDAAAFFNTSPSGGAASLGTAGGAGVVAAGSTTAKDGTPALAAVCGSGPAMIAVARWGFPLVMSLDCSGNMTLAGSLTQNGTPLAAHRTTTGEQVGEYSPQQTVASTEDLGEAQLVGGHAYVPLERTFATTIDPRASYLVFITPQGEARGTLYVTQKTSAGFAVREAQGGRSSVAFAYRIVAKPYDAAAGRLPATRVLPAPSARLVTEVSHLAGRSDDARLQTARLRAAAATLRANVRRVGGAH